MDNASLTFAASSYGLAFVAFAALASHARARYASGHFDGASRALLAAAFAGTAWAALGLGFSLTGRPAFVAAGVVADLLRYGAWYAFLLLIMNPRSDSSPGSGNSLRLLWAIAALVVSSGIVAIGWAFFLPQTLPKGMDVTWPHLLAAVVFALFLLEQFARNVSADTVWHVKPLILGLAGAFLFDLYLAADATMFKQLDPAAFAARGIVHACVVPLLWASSARTRDWFAKVRLSQKAAFHTATLVFVGGYLLFMAGVGFYVRSFGGQWSHALALAVVFALLLLLGIAVFSESTRARLRVLIGKHFFSYRYDYREEWLRFTHTLSAQQSPQGMGEQVLRGLANLVESPAGALWLLSPESRSYTQMARWNMPAVGHAEMEQGSLARFMRSSGWVVNLEEFRSFPGRYTGLDMPQWIGTVPNAWLIVPLVVGNDLIGFALLASARTDIEVDWEVNDLLRTAGRQAAAFLAQMQATEALLEARKFDSFNRMSAFVVHDLKNIVTQLSLLLKNAERHGDNPEFQADMRMTVKHSVERMRQLMLQLREGATPVGTPVGVDLAVIIERIREAKTSQGRRVEAEISERLMTRGLEERMERVIGHLVQNALDATEANSADARVWIRLARYGGLAQVEVGDNGCGMTPEFVREQLFKPFRTTKQAGMGIGAYESFQYVQELGGKIEVESAPDKGTRITLDLPLFESGSHSPSPHIPPLQEAA